MGLLTAPEKIYDGATSLVDIIRKQFGDDIDGAVEELERLGGFPEPVARRIATGELPMDAESVARRVDEQGYGDVVYRGINGEYDPDKAGYYQMFTTSEQDAAEYGGNVLEARLNLGDNAVVDGRGRNFNSIPTEDGLLVRTDDLAHEAREAGRDSLTIRNIHDKADNEIPRRPSASNTGPSDEEIMRELGLDYSPSPNASPAPDARNYDPVDVDVVFDPSRIRSPNAAFDPQYTGSNIMGNADPRLLAGTAAGTAGLLAAPMLADKDKPLPVPTWGDIGESVMNVLGMPMTGLQGLARGGYGLLTGEDFTEAAAQAGNTMDVGWRDGLLDTSGMNPDKGADQAEAYVTKKTGDESLGWMAKMGLLFGGL